MPLDPNLYILFFEEGIACAEYNNDQLELISASDRTHFPLDMHREIMSPAFAEVLNQIRKTYNFDKNPIRIDRIPSVVLFSKNLSDAEQEKIIKGLRANKFRILFQSEEKELSSDFSTAKDYLMSGFSDMRKAHFERVEDWFSNSLDESAQDSYIFFDSWLAITAKGLRAGIREERLREMVSEKGFRVVEPEDLIRKMVLEKSEDGRLSLEERRAIREKLKRWNRKEEILERILNEEEVSVLDTRRTQRLNFNKRLNTDALQKNADKTSARKGRNSGRAQPNEFGSVKRTGNKAVIRNILAAVFILGVLGGGAWFAYEMYQTRKSPAEILSVKPEAEESFEVSELEGSYRGEVYDHEFERYFYNTLKIRNIDLTEKPFSFEYEILNKGRKGLNYTGTIDFENRNINFGHDPARAYRLGKCSFDKNDGLIQIQSNTDGQMKLEKQ